VALGLFTRKKTGSGIAEYASGGRSYVPAPYAPAPEEKLDADPLKALLQQQRYNVIAAQPDKWARHPHAEAVHKQAVQALQDQLALVPQGRVTLPQTLIDAPGMPEIDLDVEPYLLDIHTVTNERYQKFVDAGAYEDLDLWPKAIWPHLIEMRDHTGSYGPRFWQNGRHDRNLSNHPVVGISWYEATAYAKWIGQRLPTEAEWQMAATWRIKSETDLFRRFPWGDALDKTRCNIWSTGIGHTIPVDAIKEGAAPNGVLQLIGNVWEWVACDLNLTTEHNEPILAEVGIKGTRGGAYDTYFEMQATGLFRTGHIAMARTHNVGFRCALSVSEAPWLSETA